MTTHKNLAEAKLGVMQEVPYILKRRSQGLNYTFASESEFIEQLHPALVKHGITITPEDMEVVYRGDYQTAKGATMQRVILRCRYLLRHADSGETEPSVTIGEASDSGDKACNKAMTVAYKYALRQAFLVETGDDPDRYAADEQEAAGSQPAIVQPTSRSNAGIAIDEAQQEFEKASAALAKALGVKIEAALDRANLDTVGAEINTPAVKDRLTEKHRSWLRGKYKARAERLAVGARAGVVAQGAPATGNGAT